MITYFHVNAPEYLAQCLTIRETVFIEEQNVPRELEVDGLDDECRHCLAMLDDKAVATARVRVLEDCFKFQRVAVLPFARGSGIGAGLMRFVMRELPSIYPDGPKRFFLSSQVSAIGFYERLGFKVCSDIYLDAGIEHRDMECMV